MHEGMHEGMVDMKRNVDDGQAGWFRPISTSFNI